MNAAVVYCAASMPFAASSAAQAVAFGSGSSCSVVRDVVVGREGRAVERRRPAGAALVEEHDVAVACARRSAARRTARSTSPPGPGPPARMNSGSGRGLSVLAGSTATVSVILRPSGRGAVLRHLELAALRGQRELGQPALGERDGAPRRVATRRRSRRRRASATASAAGPASRAARVAKVALRALCMDADGSKLVAAIGAGVLLDAHPAPGVFPVAVRARCA